MIPAGPAPENHTGRLRRFKPDFTLLVDAAEMGEAPGSVRWLPWESTLGSGASTHTLPLRLVATYLTKTLGCEVGLLGIQPADTSVCNALSPPVLESVTALAHTLAALFSERTNPPPRGGHEMDINAPLAWQIAKRCQWPGHAPRLKEHGL